MVWLLCVIDLNIIVMYIIISVCLYTPLREVCTLLENNNTTSFNEIMRVILQYLHPQSSCCKIAQKVTTSKNNNITSQLCDDLQPADTFFNSYIHRYIGTA